ncbi:hypothetical protein VKT23_018710 [Stygiomarasmius scandens]|uniref:F-box domain-containing protein n=1 Tax=Marasmiellus scandens TaxID=2682957 RepID=A0ABR1IRG2_9AGAR
MTPTRTNSLSSSATGHYTTTTTPSVHSSHSGSSGAASLHAALSQYQASQSKPRTKISLSTETKPRPSKSLEGFSKTSSGGIVGKKRERKTSGGSTSVNGEGLMARIKVKRVSAMFSPGKDKDKEKTRGFWSSRRESTTNDLPLSPTSESDSIDDIRRPSDLGRAVEGELLPEEDDVFWEKKEEDSAPFANLFTVSRSSSISTPPLHSNQALVLPKPPALATLPKSPLAELFHGPPPPPPKDLTLLSLPPTILTHILSFLPRALVARLGRTCRVFRGVVEEVLIAEMDLSGAKVDKLEEFLSRLVAAPRGRQLLESTTRVLKVPECDSDRPSDSRLVSLLALSMSLMSSLVSLTLPSYSEGLLKWHSAFNLQEVAFLRPKLDTETLLDMFRWLDGQVNIKVLKLGDAEVELEEEVEGSRLSTVSTGSAGYPSSPSSFKTAFEEPVSTPTLTLSPPSVPFAPSPRSPSSPSSPFSPSPLDMFNSLMDITQSQTLLPSLRTLHAPPAILNLLVPHRRDTIEEVGTSLDKCWWEDGIKEFLKLIAEKELDILRLAFANRVDKRSVEKVLRGVGAQLEGLEVSVPEWNGSKTDEVLYKIISMVIPRYRRLRTLILKVSDGEEGDGTTPKVTVDDADKNKNALNEHQDTPQNEDTLSPSISNTTTPTQSSVPTPTAASYPHLQQQANPNLNNDSSATLSPPTSPAYNQNRFSIASLASTTYSLAPSHTSSLSAAQSHFYHPNEDIDVVYNYLPPTPTATASTVSLALFPVPPASPLSLASDEGKRSSVYSTLGADGRLISMYMMNNESESAEGVDASTPVDEEDKTVAHDHDADLTPAAVEPDDEDKPNGSGSGSDSYFSPTSTVTGYFSPVSTFGTVHSPHLGPLKPGYTDGDVPPVPALPPLVTPEKGKSGKSLSARLSRLPSLKNLKKQAGKKSPIPVPSSPLPVATLVPPTPTSITANSEATTDTRNSIDSSSKSARFSLLSTDSSAMSIMSAADAVIHHAGRSRLTPVTPTFRTINGKQDSLFVLANPPIVKSRSALELRSVDEEEKEKEVIQGIVEEMDLREEKEKEVRDAPLTERERHHVGLWMRHCPTLERIVLVSGKVWDVHRSEEKEVEEIQELESESESAPKEQLDFGLELL